MPKARRELDAAVEQLYRAFARQPRREQIEFCDHCVSPQEAQALVTTPMREIGAELLTVFMLNAMAETWGDWEDLKCYLPRVLELIADGSIDRYDFSNLFSHLGIRWRGWLQEQQRALSKYLIALWHATLASYWYPSSVDVLDVLEAAAEMGLPVGSYVRHWETRGSENAALHLAWLIRSVSARWPGNPAEEWRQAVYRWLSGPAPRTVITSAFASASTPEIAANFSEALDMLDSWASRG